ncbi:hypothetical protein FA13DRAFT_1736278 [Coprinellus micaceus]|uniref:Uncharacterized protein n=1 Tax=Coprinellus micaceus TaxID=71717 RepID=A0A4Y7T0X8_COPMI|nr:hypothetical protein FA13DRAFT_1736278 [Coprinellus micaceus]
MPSLEIRKGVGVGADSDGRGFDHVCARVDTASNAGVDASEVDRKPRCERGKRCGPVGN